MTLGAINHVALTVSDLVDAEARMKPLLEFLGYERAEALDGLSVWVSEATGTAVNLWQAHEDLRDRTHRRYAPGLHHLAFNADSREQVDAFYQCLLEQGATVLDLPAEYDYAPATMQCSSKGRTA